MDAFVKLQTTLRLIKMVAMEKAVPFDFTPVMPVTLKDKKSQQHSRD